MQEPQRAAPTRTGPRRCRCRCAGRRRRRSATPECMCTGIVELLARGPDRVVAGVVVGRVGLPHRAGSGSRPAGRTRVPGGSRRRRRRCRRGSARPRRRPGARGRPAQSSASQRLWARAPASSSSGAMSPVEPRPAPNGADVPTVTASASGKMTSPATPSASSSLSRRAGVPAAPEPLLVLRVPLLGELLVEEALRLRQLGHALAAPRVRRRTSRGTRDRATRGTPRSGRPAWQSAEITRYRSSITAPRRRWVSLRVSCDSARAADLLVGAIARREDPEPALPDPAERLLGDRLDGGVVGLDTRGSACGPRTTRWW